jgi:glycosyltransferase involved in cell wall biosynthesis
LKRLAIITSHPIQYNAPWFALLATGNKIVIKVFYTWGGNVLKDKYDPGFGKKVVWDIPLLEGYDYTFVKNISPDAGSHHFRGIINPTLNKEIEEWNADALLVFGWAFVSHLKCIRYFHKKIPILFRGDSTLLGEKTGIKKSLRRLFLRWVYKHINYALYVGIENKKYFQKYGLKNNQLVFAPHAIDNNRFNSDDVKFEKQASVWKNKLGILPNESIILYAGKLESIKDPYFIIGLSERLKSLPVKFLIVGNGPMEAFLKKGAQTNKQLIFLDFQNQLDMPVVYRLGDIFILPSKSETWGLSVNEAMACGRCVLVSEACGCAADLVSDGINGYIFSKDNIENLVKKIEGLINDRTLLKKMGTESVKKIKSFSFEHIVKPIESVLE